MTGSGVEVVPADASPDDAFDVRRSVFVEEQGVPLEREMDGHDETATHFVARDVDRTAVGTARLRVIDEDTGKVERVAVLRTYRGEGWGRRLMVAVEEAAKDRDLSRLVLHAQTAVEGFYRELGYETTTDVFEEAGIPHVEMEKSIDGC